MNYKLLWFLGYILLPYLTWPSSHVIAEMVQLKGWIRNNCYLHNFIRLFLHSPLVLQKRESRHNSTSNLILATRYIKSATHSDRRSMCNDHGSKPKKKFSGLVHFKSAEWVKFLPVQTLNFLRKLQRTD